MVVEKIQCSSSAPAGVCSDVCGSFSVSDALCLKKRLRTVGLLVVKNRENGSIPSFAISALTRKPQTLRRIGILFGLAEKLVVFRTECQVMFFDM
jgi:hypothetical protein